MGAPNGFFPTLPAIALAPAEVFPVPLNCGIKTVMAYCDNHDFNFKVCSTCPETKTIEYNSVKQSSAYTILRRGKYGNKDS